MKSYFVSLFLVISLSLFAINPDVKTAQNFNQGIKWGFEENKGQVTGQDSAKVKFFLKQGNLTMFLLNTGIAYQFEKRHYPEGYKPIDKFASLEEIEKYKELLKLARTETYRMDLELIEANLNAEIIKEVESSDYIQYYNHNALGVHSYQKLTYKNIYPNIDWVIFKTDTGIKYDFIVHPGGNPKLIKFKTKWVEDIKLDKGGNVILKNRMGEIKELSPYSYQKSNTVNSKFSIVDNNIGFEIDKYDASIDLTIDPNVIWGTYFGDINFETSNYCFTDTFNNVYIAGESNSSNNIAFGGHQSTVGGITADALLVKFNSAGNRLWATYYGGYNLDNGIACMTDKTGNAYLIGWTASPNNISFNGHQNTLAVVSGNQDAFLVKFNSNGVRQWATYYGGGDLEGAQSCAIDTNGDILLGGYTFSISSIFFNGHQATKGSFADGFLVRFNSAGTRLWATYYGGNGGDNIASINIDNSGNLIIAGSTGSTNNMTLNATQSTFGGFASDGFIAKFTSAGVRLWSTYYGSTAEDRILDCTLDNSNNIIVCGTTASSTNMAVGGFQTTYGGGGHDMFLVKFDNSATRLWSTYFGGSGTEVGNASVKERNGSIYLFGQTTSTSNIAFNGFQNTYGGSNKDVCLAKYNSSGSRVWATYCGGSFEDWSGSTAIDKNGDIYISGKTWSTNNISLNGFQNSRSGTASDAFLVKIKDETILNISIYRTSGTPLCSGANINLTHSKSIPPNWSNPKYKWYKNNILVDTNSTYNPVSLVTGDTVKCLLKADSLGIKYDSVWSNTIIITINSSTSFTKYDTICSGKTYMFNGINRLTSGVYLDTLINAKGCDSFLTLNLLVKPISSDTIKDSVCKGIAYMFNGNNLTISGTYRDTLINVRGCDSFVTLNFVIKQPSFDTIKDSSCQNSSYVFNGQQLYTSGMYKDTLLNSRGCDSFLVLYLTVKDTTRKDSAINVCKNAPIVYNGQTIHTSGVYRDTFVNSKGCDSFLVLNLTVLDTSRKDSSLVICRNFPILFNGKTINTIGEYRDTFTNSKGCDSFLVLNLTVIDSSRKDSALFICRNSPILFNGKTINTSGVYRDTFTNAKGCDSFLVLNLTVIDSSRKDSSLTICRNSPILFNGKTINTSGVYRDTFTNAKGCDSFLILNLTVIDSSRKDSSLTICRSSPIVFNGKTINTNGVYRDTFISSKGCDSFLVLSLTVNQNLIRPDFDTSINLCYSYAPSPLNSTSPNGIIGIWNPSVIDNKNSSTYVYTPNPNQCALSTTLNVKVNPLPIVKFDYFLNDTICIGDSVRISIQGESNYSYRWNNGSTQSSFIIYPTENLEYIVTVSNSFGCSIVDTAKIFARSIDVKIKGPVKVKKGDIILLNAVSSSPIFQYMWSPLDNFKNQQNKQVSLRVENPLVVELDVKDSFGCSASDIFPIQLVGSDILIPDAFSPNKDGINDIFKPIYKEHVKVLTFKVFNRWGELVYNYDQNSKIGWDGEYNGEKCPVGIYIYYTEYSVDSKLHKIEGNVTLIR